MEIYQVMAEMLWCIWCILHSSA